MVANLQERFKSFNLTFSIGGQIVRVLHVRRAAVRARRRSAHVQPPQSFDVFPTGWDVRASWRAPRAGGARLVVMRAEAR